MEKMQGPQCKVCGAPISIGCEHGITHHLETRDIQALPGLLSRIKELKQQLMETEGTMDSTVVKKAIKDIHDFYNSTHGSYPNLTAPGTQFHKEFNVLIDISLKLWPKATKFQFKNWIMMDQS